MACPLCGEKRFIKIKSFDTKKLANNYRKNLKVNVEKYYKEENLDLLQCINCGMEYFPKGIEGDGKFYENLSRFDWYYMEDKFEYRVALKKIRELKPKSILEIGSGQGFFLDHVRDCFQVHATEHNPDAIRVLKEKGIPLDEEGMKYDFIVTFQVLEHVKDLGNFVKWILSKIEKDGYLFIAVPNPESEYISEVPGILDIPPHHMNHIFEETLRKFADLFDMTVVDYFTEPMASVHLSGLLNKRTKEIYDSQGSSNFIKRFVKKVVEKTIVQGAQAALVPVMYDMAKWKGHTHGILLQKNN